MEGAEHFYFPFEVKLPLGATVTWTIVGQAQHDVVAENGAFSSPLLGPGQCFSHTFTEPSWYDYYCNPHRGDGMLGVITAE